MDCWPKLLVGDGGSGDVLELVGLGEMGWVLRVVGLDANPQSDDDPDNLGEEDGADDGVRGAESDVGDVIVSIIVRDCGGEGC